MNQVTQIHLKYQTGIDPYYETADIPSNAGSSYENQSYNLQSSLAVVGINSALTDGIDTGVIIYR